ncbi:MAG: hypothetical protein AAF587_11560 [Bacteroidota bacterium]
MLIILTLLSISILIAQSGQELITSIEQNGGNKTKVLSTLEAEILKITQADFPDWNITGVSIDSRTGVMTVSGTDHKGNSFSYTGKKFGDLLSGNSTYFRPQQGKSASSYGFFGCMRRRFAGLPCDPAVRATNLKIPNSDLDAVEQDYRRRWLIMLHA